MHGPERIRMNYLSLSRCYDACCSHTTEWSEDVISVEQADWCKACITHLLTISILHEAERFTSSHMTFLI